VFVFVALRLRRRDFSFCRWQTGDGVPCVRRDSL